MAVIQATVSESDAVLATAVLVAPFVEEAAKGVFVLCVNDRFLVRRVQRGLKGNVRLICDNPAFDDEILDESEFADENQDGIAVIGVVVGRILLGGR